MGPASGTKKDERRDLSGDRGQDRMKASDRISVVAFWSLVDTFQTRYSRFVRIRLFKWTIMTRFFVNGGISRSHVKLVSRFFSWSFRGFHKKSRLFGICCTIPERKGVLYVGDQRREYYSLNAIVELTQHIHRESAKL